MRVITIVVGLIGLGCLILSAAVFSIGLFGAWNTDLDSAAIFRPQIAIAAFLAAGLMLFAGWRRLTIGAGLLGIASLALLGPAWDRPASIDIAAFPSAKPGCHIERLRVATANVEGSTPGASETLATVARLDVDVLATVETTRYFDQLGAKPDGPFPFSTRYKSVALWSRTPMRAVAVPPLPRPRPARALGEISVGGRSIGLAAIHLPRPIIKGQAGAVEKLPTVLKDFPSDRIILGDFNSAIWTATMKKVAALSGVRLTGGFRISWHGTYPTPVKGWRLPSLFGTQIDHILTSPNIGFRSIETFALPGSVHEGVIAELEVPSAECGDR